MTSENDPLFSPTLPPESYQFKSSRKKGRRKVADQDVREQGDYCFVDGEVYVRVTSALKVLDKPMLGVWKCKQVYLAATADPTISMSEALKAPDQIADVSRKRGTTAHSVIEAYEHTQQFLDNVDESIRGFVQGFRQWVTDYSVDIIEHERKMVSRKFGFGGKMDLLVRINGNPLPAVVDAKFSKSIYPESFLQTSAYRQLLKEQGVETCGGATLALQEDGGYKYEFDPTDYFRQFYACLVLFNWQHADELENLRRRVRNGGNGNGKAKVPVSGS